MHKQIQKDSAFGTVFRCGNPREVFNFCFAKKVSKEGDPTKHEGPYVADNRVGGGRDWLVPRSGVFQGDI